MKSILAIILLILASYTHGKALTVTKRGNALSATAASSATINGLKNSVASAFAAATAKTLLAPFDTIKTIQQQSQSGEVALTLVEAASVAMKRPKGFLELYAGLGVSAIGAMPSVGLYFGVYSYCKDQLTPFFQKKCDGRVDPNAVRTFAIACSAAIGNTVASFSRVPYEVVKQKLQTGEYTSTFGAIGHMYKNGGMRSFFPMGGITIQMMRDIPYAIVTLMTYECLREHWVNKRPKSAWRDMVTGGLAGGVGSFVTNPMDVIKTRLQVDSSNLYKGSVWVCVSKTLQEGGPSVFLRGSVPRLIHKIPANAAFFVSYEFFRRLLRVEDIPASGTTDTRGINKNTK
jgi:solute carrier family 25 S-adenosylmethionine transporter 26